jgi:hypothetical protein
MNAMPPDPPRVPRVEDLPKPTGPVVERPRNPDGTLKDPAEPIEPPEPVEREGEDASGGEPDHHEIPREEDVESD